MNAANMTIFAIFEYSSKRDLSGYGNDGSQLFLS